MGIYKIEKCVFTDLPITNIDSDFDGIEYFVKAGKNRIKIILPFDAESWEHNSSFFKENKYIAAGLIFNNLWFKEDQKISLENLQELIESIYYPKSPQEKADNLLLGLLSMQKEEGQSLEVEDLFLQKREWKKYFFKSFSEANFYLKHLLNQNLINAETYNHLIFGLVVSKVSISFNGLSYLDRLQRDGEKSKNCFIAMAFSDETIEIRETIKNAVTECGYIPIIIDEQHVQSDKTINDEIIASLKRSKFCIADFTLHRNGVYFESGFALGQGKKVIYTCRQDEFSKAHFDIRPLQHIIYTNQAEFLKALVFKIQAFID